VKGYPGDVPDGYLGLGMVHCGSTATLCDMIDILVLVDIVLGHFCAPYD